jgi:amino acid transporter
MSPHFLMVSKFLINNTYLIVYLGSRIIPEDGPPTSYFFDDKYLIYFTYIIVVLSLFTCMLISVTIVVKRKTKAVRQKSVKFVIFALVGCLCIVLTPLVYVQRPNTLTCNLKLWLPALGLFIIHIALISRELLISSIFNEKNVMQRRSTWTLYKPVIIFGSICCVFETVNNFCKKEAK